jgi:hypothetical protein
MRESFYRERDLRTANYGLPAPLLEIPVGIALGSEALLNPAGQAAGLALINMVARLHRSIRVVTPDGQLLVRSLAGGSSFAEAAYLLVKAIDPFNDIQIEKPGKLTLPQPTLGIGSDTGARWVVSANRYTASIGNEPLPFGADPSTLLGACLAASFGAATLINLVLGAEPIGRRVSLWSLDEESGEMSGPGESTFPLDVGDVAVIGAGAVGSSLAYWLMLLGVRGHWVFVDRDQVELHNTSRSLGLLAADAGWSAQGPSGIRSYKAETTGTLLHMSNAVLWYDEWIEQSDFIPDLLLPLANGPGLRRLVGQRGDPVLLHATTSRNWSADLHRHLAESDGCIACRFPDNELPQFECSTSSVTTDSQPVDAALPFLSASAGLLLVTALERLACDRLELGHSNNWELYLDSRTAPLIRSRRWECSGTCTVRRNMPQQVRRRIPRGRWSKID